MIKTLLKQIGEYKRDTIITPIFTVLEVVAELLVPFVIASLIDKAMSIIHISEPARLAHMGFAELWL